VPGQAFWWATKNGEKSMIYVKNEPSFFAGVNKQPRTAEGRLASFRSSATCIQNAASEHKTTDGAKA